MFTVHAENEFISYDEHVNKIKDCVITIQLVASRDFKLCAFDSLHTQGVIQRETSKFN